jgi:histidyl-tRNA synthetase
VGWAAGVERMLLAAGEADVEQSPRVFISHTTDAPLRLQLAQTLRRLGLRVEMEQAGRSMKGQMKQADRIGASVTVILGEGIEVKDMTTGEQRQAETYDDVVEMVREVTDREAPAS